MVLATRQRRNNTLNDPIAFGHELFSALGAKDDADIISPALRAETAFEASVDEVTAAFPDGTSYNKPISNLIEAARVYAMDMHSCGIEFGVAAERLRQDLKTGADGPHIPWLRAGDKAPDPTDRAS